MVLDYRAEELIGYFFSYDLYYKELYDKINDFIKHFDLDDYINFKAQTYKNPCHQCHYQNTEPLNHRKAKEKIFKLFVNTPNYLILTEVKAKNHITDLDLEYQLDCLVINIKNLSKFFQHCQNRKFQNLDQEMLKAIQHNIIFIVELDGEYHSYKKDKVRDNFYLDNFNVMTLRYRVNHLVRDENISPQKKKKKLKHANIRTLLTDDIFEAPLANISITNVLNNSKEMHDNYLNKLLPR